MSATFAPHFTLMAAVVGEFMQRRHPVRTQIKAAYTLYRIGLLKLNAKLTLFCIVI
jgi:hypothetical protein